MEVSEILSAVLIGGLLLIAMPFPIVIAAAAVAWGLAGFMAVLSVLGFTDEPGADQEGRSRPGG
jgi:hypothetical protein